MEKRTGLLVVANSEARGARSATVRRRDMFFCCYFFLSFWIIVKLLFLLLGLIGLKWGEFYVVWGKVRWRSEEIAIAEGYGFRGRRHSLGVVWGLADF